MQTHQSKFQLSLDLLRRLHRAWQLHTCPQVVWYNGTYLDSHYGSCLPMSSLFYCTKCSLTKKTYCFKVTCIDFKGRATHCDCCLYVEVSWRPAINNLHSFIHSLRRFI